MKGHFISFDHDAPQVMSKIFDKKDVCASLRLVFVGTDSEVVWLMKETLGLKSDEVITRGWVLYQWAAVLKEVNPLYKDLDIPRFSEVNDIISQCNQAMVESADCISDENWIKFEERIGDDVAKVCNANIDDGSSSFSHSFVTSRNKLINTIEIAESSILQGAKAAFIPGTQNGASQEQSGSDSDGSGEENIQSHNKARSAVCTNGPINEFRDNNKAIVGSFPDVFLLGNLFGDDDQGSLSFQEMNHILLQFTNAAARTPDLLFFLFHQMQRHSNIENIHSRVRSNPKASAEFAEMTISPEFLGKLKKNNRKSKR